MGGSVTINPHLRIGYFAQHFADSLQMDISPVQHLAKKFPEAPYQELRKALGQFGLPGKIHTQPIQTLSGGQKNRVVFAGMLWKILTFCISMNLPTILISKVSRRWLWLSKS